MMRKLIKKLIDKYIHSGLTHKGYIIEMNIDCADMPCEMIYHTKKIYASEYQAKEAIESIKRDYEPYRFTKFKITPLYKSDTQNTKEFNRRIVESWKVRQNLINQLAKKKDRIGLEKLGIFLPDTFYEL